MGLVTCVSIGTKGCPAVPAIVKLPPAFAWSVVRPDSVTLSKTTSASAPLASNVAPFLDSTSFAMAMLTGAALLCYVTLLVLTGGIPETRGQRETEPLLVSVPAARPEEPAEYQDDYFGAEPGWDDDPGWAERLRRGRTVRLTD